MRITENSISSNSLYYLQQGQARTSKLSEQIGTQANINRPSDDPIGTSLLLSVNDQIKAVDQDTSNISKATTSLNVASTALTGMSSTMQLAKKLLASISGGSSATSSDDAKTIRLNALSQLQTYKQQIVDMGNTQYGDQYIFGGTNNSAPTFLSKPGDLNGSDTVSNVNVTGLTIGMQVSGTGIPAGAMIGTIDNISVPASFTLVDSAGSSLSASATTAGAALNFYNGDSNQSSIKIAQNYTQTLNVTGDRLLKGTGSNPSYGSTDIFQTFDSLITAISGDGVVGSVNEFGDLAAIQAGTQALEAGAKQINNAQGDIASRLVRLTNVTSMNTNIKNTFENVISSTQSADYAKLGVELTAQQTAFNAALSATAKIAQMSLLDYLK